MRTVALLLIVTLLAASLPLGASTAKRACCTSKSSCPMKHHAKGCAIRCGVSVPAPRATAAIRDVSAMPAAVALPLPLEARIAFDVPRAARVAFASPPPTPPPL